MRRALAMTAFIILCCTACAPARTFKVPLPELQLKVPERKMSDRIESRYIDVGGHPWFFLEEIEKETGQDKAGAAIDITLLANMYARRGGPGWAELLYGRALIHQEAAFGLNHSNVAISSIRLADFHFAERRYSQAQPLYERALAIQEASLRKDHPDLATALARLASLYYVQGHYSRAEPLFQRALVIRVIALGKDHPGVATSLLELALLHASQGHYTQAEPLFQRALAIQEAALGKNHPEVATSLSSFADIYYAQGHYSRAEPLYERALAIQEVSLDKNELNVATALARLASLYYYQGRYARVEPLVQRALVIQEAALGKNHPDVVATLNRLALLRLAQQNPTEALILLERALIASENYLRQEVVAFSEAYFTSRLNDFRVNEEHLYALVRARPEDVQVQQLAVSTALLRKGRSVEEVANISRAFHRGDSRNSDSFQTLRRLRTQFAEQSFTDPARIPSEDQLWLGIMEAYLTDLSSTQREHFALPPPDKILGRVAAALPRDGVLVEFVAYRDSPLIPPPGTSPSQVPSELRYLALLLFADGRTSAVDLGPAAPIERAVQSLRDALARPVVEYQTAAQELYALAFHPLAPLLGDVRRLFLSPDGQLALIPFAALHNGSHFLVDVFDITYVTSGRDLLLRSAGITPAQSVIVLAAPEFYMPPTPSSPAASSRAAEAIPELAEHLVFPERAFSTLRSSLADQPWPPLPGSRQEGEAIQQLLPQTQLLLGQAATKEALLKLDTPGILHIATHGFFLEDGSAPKDSRAVGNFGAVGDRGPKHRPPEPLLRSGLVLASALSGSRRYKDSLVTALELAGLDLWGTQLVVLSACDTGRGDVKLGQGVYGMRRALVVAGAETVVTSLWKVNDETTLQLMEDYYRNLLGGQGRTAALQEAMRVLRQQRPHPHYWAPFISIGQDAPLRQIEASKPITEGDEERHGSDRTSSSHDAALGQQIATGPQPDLVVTSVQAPASIQPDVVFTTYVTLCNQGNGLHSGSQVAVRLYPNTSTLREGSFVGSTFVGDVAPGSCTVALLTSSSSAPTGQYSLIASADATSSILELNEDNNDSAPHLLLINSGPDLIVSVSAPARVGPGDAFNVTTTVCNQGTTHCQPTGVDVFLSSDPTFSIKEDMHFSTPVDSLLPGECRTLTVPGPVSLPAGTWFLGASVDGFRGMVELREDNNTASPSTIVIGYE